MKFCFFERGDEVTAPSVVSLDRLTLYAQTGPVQLTEEGVSTSYPRVGSF